MKSFIDYYFVLGISNHATKEEIRSAYRSRAKLYHPDLGGSEAAFKIVKEAYDTLYDERMRERYDVLYQMYSVTDQHEPEKKKESNEQQKTETKGYHETNHKQKAESNSKKETNHEKKTETQTESEPKHEQKTETEEQKPKRRFVVASPWKVFLFVVIFLIILCPLLLFHNAENKADVKESASSIEETDSTDSSSSDTTQIQLKESDLFWMYPGSGYFTQKYETDATTGVHFGNLATNVVSIKMTHSAQEEDGVTSPYYGKPLVTVTVEFDNNGTKPVHTTLGSEGTKISLNQDEYGNGNCDFVSPNFTGDIPPSSKMIFDLLFISDNFQFDKSLSVADLSWKETHSRANQTYDYNISMPINPE